jgi:hypothetical protein
MHNSFCPWEHNMWGRDSASRILLSLLSDFSFPKSGEYAVSSDRSIAAATNFQVTAGEAARAQMPSMEYKSWEAFLRGSILLPDID